ncbi:MAG: glycoside hydrolase/phage tail family protein, partial [Pseudomonadota bacterium]
SSLGTVSAALRETPLTCHEGRPVYGGTPSDTAVLEAIAAMKAQGQAVMFYPFILMEQQDGNVLMDPYSGGVGQPVLPWRGRITTSLAAGVTGTPDKTAAAADEVAAFFGQATPSDFAVTANGVTYTGPVEFSYRRFILHYAHLCALAGGVDAFCIGSEMRGLTRIRSDATTFPAVEALRQLAGDVRAIVGPDVKISYAADWSEYFGYHPQDGTGDVFFNLDPLWADPVIDFIGIDNYMPVSDWRDGQDHADATWGSIYNLEYLKANIAGGEGFEWYYHAPEAEAIQLRTPITDGAYGEPWVFRYKDLAAWWSNTHHDRPGGVREAVPTAWVPGSKPFWFTEIGCAAIDKGTNQPNKFLDPKSSESALPKYSNGARDDLLQMQFLRAIFEYWEDPSNNPDAALYAGRMLETRRSFIWAWDARPYPFFPGNTELWSDGGNYARGHWLNGRVGARALSSVVREICETAGVPAVKTDALYGAVKGYSTAGDDTARSVLQPLMLAYGFDAVERDGALVFRTRTGREDRALGETDLVLGSAETPTIAAVRAPEAEISGRVRLTFVEADGDYETRAVEAAFPDDTQTSVSQSEMPLVLTQAEGLRIVERWLAEARIARDQLQFEMPPSGFGLGAGDVVRLEEEGASGTFRIDRVEQGASQRVEAVRVESGTYTPSDAVESEVAPRVFNPALPVEPVFLDLPLVSGDEVEHAPSIGATASPWPGDVAVYRSATGADFVLDSVLSVPAGIGVTESAFAASPPGRFDRSDPLRVRFGRTLQSVTQDQLLAGANRAAVAIPGTNDWEVFQFQDARLVDDGLWDVSLRLRGQAGTDHLAATERPAGAMFVLLDGAILDTSLAANQRGVAQVWRVGPASRAVSDPSFVETIRAFEGVGLRPYSPVHLRGTSDGMGGVKLSWIRRTRIDGDNWSGLDVPMGEASELYMLRVVQSGSILREVTLARAEFDYTAGLRSSDGVGATFEIEVAQVSDRFGPGPFRRITWND